MFKFQSKVKFAAPPNDDLKRGSVTNQKNSFFFLFFLQFFCQMSAGCLFCDVFLGSADAARWLFQQGFKPESMHLVSTRRRRSAV